MIEWKNHASSFSVNWLAAMRAKRKIVTVHPDGEGSYEVRIQDISGFTPRQIAAMEKDLLLILAALETDGLIASCDSKARDLFAQAAVQIADIRGIVWVNPNETIDHCSDWLKSGARHTSERSLGAFTDT